MSKGVNTFIGVGNMGFDPDYAVSTNGTEVARVSIAFNDNRGGQENTTWLTAKFFKKAADIIRDYAKKGTRIYVRGRISIDEWDHKEHPVKMHRACVLVDEFVLLDGRENETKGKGNDYKAAKNGEPKPEFNDDIPF